MQIILDDIRKSFKEKQVLRSCSGQFRPGGIYGLLGRNGAGKTTLFRIISQDLDRDGGRILVTDTQAETPERELRPDEVGFIQSQPVLPDFLTGYEFIKFFMDLQRRPEDMLSIEDYFSRYRFEQNDLHRLIKDYSHGMKSKLHLMTMDISRPPVILLDEPLTSLDVVVAAEMKHLLQDLKRNSILIFSTHILELAKTLCDHIVLLRRGRLESLDTLSNQDPDYEDEIIRLLSQAEDSTADENSATEQADRPEGHE